MNNEPPLRIETTRFTGTVGLLFPVPLAATIEVYPDYDATPPDQTYDHEPELFLIDTRDLLERKLAEAFGADAQDYTYPNKTAWACFNRLCQAEIIRTRDGAWYYPVSKYEHSSIALALAGSGQALGWPDQMWDVTRLAGWVKVTRELRIAWGIHGSRGVQEHALANVKDSVRLWEAYLNGWNTLYAARLVDEETGAELDGEVVGGYIDIDDALEQGMSTVKAWQQTYGH